ncbi:MULTISPECIES: ABC transporter substrate-binding protein [unclassified Duganella]|uniref:ABC transporter substrate-binding protein n=1 Tax=unclassified Duganella TaxID=2636909 RepID=UPI0008898DD3|nr:MULTISPECIES: ABC transporter substrate-binding protein [unclassified Duganella]SDH27126.1 ABC-type transport system, substrate-binding protein [Duganella sp. OV458]SDK40845.1 ABC-type transport system, substrate-binding protein [Duganella sp. OV510]
MGRLLKKCAAIALALAAPCIAAPAAVAPANAAAHTEHVAPTAAPKILRAFLSTGETGLDPAVASDVASLSLLENLFDPLLRYDYLARPVKLIPNTVAAMPEISDDGLRYTFRLRQDIYFTPDAAFNGSRRQASAADYVYSFARLRDPALKSPWLYLFDGMAAIDAPDKFTLRIRLKAADPNFLYYLAMPATSVVAQEVVEAYGAQTGNHPVGTGPFKIGSWKHSDQITLLANRDFRPTEFQGRRLPILDRIDIRIVEEYQSRVLGFLNGEFDFLEQLPESMKELVLTPDAQLKPELASKGIVLAPFPVLQTYYMWMNMDDPLIGGYSKDKLALRRAIALGYNSAEDIATMKKGLALRAVTPLPPNVLGNDPGYRSPVRYDPALANALLDRYGYRKGKDGFRTQPDGKPLQLVMHSEASTVGRLRDELWRKNLHAIGLKVSFKSDKKTEIIKASRLGAVMMFETNWVADFPDGDNFYQLLYGPNAGRANYARFNLPAYNQRYEQARTMGESPQRTALYDELANLIHAYTPWVLLTHPISADLQQPWLKNYRRHPVEFTNWRYLDVDAHTAR